LLNAQDMIEPTGLAPIGVADAAIIVSRLN